MKCNKCGKENRQEALFCRFCGEEISQSSESIVPIIKTEKASHNNIKNELKIVDGFIGHESIREDLNKFINKRRIEKRREQSGFESDLTNQIMMFYGNTGTGKLSVAQWFADKLKNEKLINGKTATFFAKELKAKYEDEFALKSFLDQNSFGVLILKEVHFETEYLGEILRALSTNKSGCICICIGIKTKLDSYFKDNPDSKQRINSFFEFKNYSDEILFEILEYKLNKKGLKYSDDVSRNLSQFVIEANNKENKDHENGWFIEKDLIPEILEHQADRLSSLDNPSDEDFVTITNDDIPVKNKKRSKEEIFASLDALIGLTDAKNQIKELMHSVEAAKARVEKGLGGELPKIHIQFIGNPGTGKTTIARMLGELFNAIGLLPSSKVIECDRSKLVAQYVGHTAPRVNEYCDKAIGGILFIDEAYALKQGEGDSFGQEAVDTLLKRMEDDRGKFIVIAAGYKDEMAKFIASNSGFESRFTHKIELPDYNADELIAIYKLYARNKEYVISVDAEKTLTSAISKIYETRSKTFANARTIRNLFDETIRRQSKRVMLLSESEQTKEAYMEIKAEDILIEEETQSVSKDDILKELDGMIGLEGVKKAVRELMDSIEMAKERAQQTGNETKNPIKHIVFTGNPGTGKTTVARILGKLFKSIGLLPEDRVLEVARGEMVGQYLGSTAPLVNSVCDNAIGGTLFIDEAYTLNQGKDDQFGHEAIDTLLKRMEDDRGKYVVIAAGYKHNMDDFIQSNPGLKSRFTTFIHLEDYNTNELFALFELYAKKEKFIIDESAIENLKSCISSIYENRGPDFANGRTIRNFYDKVKEKQSSRIVKLSKEERSKVLCILASDDISNAFNEMQEAE
ncbi:MAG: AAA family ATPase [Treponema sp.]|nr:AAA family ATPase [Candidatus Treponema merdequi]